MINSVERITWHNLGQQLYKRYPEAENIPIVDLPEKPLLTIHDIVQNDLHPRIVSAYDFADMVHANHFRNSGEPYITHLEAVTDTILNWYKTKDLSLVNSDLIIAALLHDTVEDQGVELTEIKERFGEKVAEYVDGVTELRSEKKGKPNDEDDSKQARDSETIRKNVDRGYKAIEVYIIKLADRLHNMRTLNFVPEDKQMRKAEETQTFIEIAKALGMWEVKTELEDLAFRYTHPEEYKKIKAEIENDPRRNAIFINDMKAKIQSVLEDSNIKARIETRYNGIYALHEKRIAAAAAAKNSPDNFFNINDLVSFRVITDDVDSSRIFAGRINDLFGSAENAFGNEISTDPSRADEFIADPRPNGYRAIHTTLKTPIGAIEIATATEDMEDFNNWGVISLKRRGEDIPPTFVPKIVFTTEGEVVVLGINSIGTDLAYKIDPKRAAYATHVIINGELQPISSLIPNAANVEIVFLENHNGNRVPNHNQQFALPDTQGLIEDQKYRYERQLKTTEGRKLMEPFLMQFGILDLSDIPNYLPDDFLLHTKIKSSSVDELYFKIGASYIKPETVTEQIKKHAYLENFDLGTISVSGSKGVDEPGIISMISWLIADANGSIVSEYLDRPRPDEEQTYTLRYVFTGIGQDMKDLLRELVEADGRFNKCIVI